MTILNTTEVQDVARNSVNIFRRHGLDTCLTGGVASNLFGVSRTPNDVDLLVLSTRDQEELKRILVNADSDFYLINARDPAATYKVLWCRLPGSSIYRRRSCKVDILTPGVMNIPQIPVRMIETIGGLPAMPLVAVVLLKLQAWSDHRAASRTDMQMKQYTDVRDLAELLVIARRRGEVADARRHPWLPADFVAQAQRRVVAYVALYPDTAEGWRRLGFRTAAR